MKLTLEQKSYLKSIDSKKKRKKQKKEFKIHNLLFGNDIDETLENLYSKMKNIKHKTTYFITDGIFKYEIEPPIDFGKLFKKEDTTLTKDMLKDLTQQKEEYKGILENVSENLHNAFKATTPICNQEPDKKMYSLADMKKCWFKSRKEHSFYTGIDFDSFVKSLEK